VVAVIVDDGDAAHLAHLGEAAVDAAEARQRLADLVALHAEMRATATAPSAFETL
jgi:hypothetical protein